MEAITMGVAVSATSVEAAVIVAIASIKSAIVVKVAAIQPAVVKPEPAADKGTSVVRPSIIRASISVIPRPGTDKDSVHKVARPIVTVRCAPIWIVRVIAIRASRRSRYIARPNSDADANSDLRLRVSQRDHQHTSQRQIF